MNKFGKRQRVILCWIISLTFIFLLGRAAEAAIQCYQCHGSEDKISHTVDYRPKDSPFRCYTSGGFQGNHRTHMPASAKKEDCETCHPGSTDYNTGHRNGYIYISPNANNSPAKTVYGSYSRPFKQTPTPALQRCSGVNCHFENLSPQWGDAVLPQNACTTCHGAPPSDGAHGKKHGIYYGTGTDSCTKCHKDHTQESNRLAHAFEAGKRPLNVQLTTYPNAFGKYTGRDLTRYLPSQNPPLNGSCVDLYCHSDGTGRAPNIKARWSGTATTKCYSCHNGTTTDNTPADCVTFGGTWDASKNICAPFINMTSNGHGRLVGPNWIRKYPCTYCHTATVTALTDVSGKISDGAIVPANHVNGAKDISMHSKWAIVGKDAPSYNPSTKVCDNVYCHSDGTTNPEAIRAFAWTEPKTNCNTCHGHPRGSCDNAGCHDGRIDPVTGNPWPIKTGWPSGEEWKASIPMFPNAGPGTARANSHARHTETNFTCDQCHASTTINGQCTDCHKTGIPPGSMTEVAHLNADYHVNKSKDVVFLGGGSYNSTTKACSNTTCHTGGVDPVWGETVVTVICLNCHGTLAGDVDDFDAFNGSRGKINLTEWRTTGHGRPASDGNYPGSNNPPAGFPADKPCWYCHDNTVLHKDGTNPYRLRMHQQFAKRYEKECGYCHMEGIDSECLGCHNKAESLALQVTYTSVQIKHGNQVITSGCRTATCHSTDATLHKTGSPFWTKEQNEDVRNQYMMMGVCLKCHDDDSGGKCVQCHTAPASNPLKYSLGFDPGTGRVQPVKARATSVHFGYKHYRAFEKTGGWTKDANGKPIGTWKGGKFCWDCHDAHGDTNIYMIQNKVATKTDGRFGTPDRDSRKDVVFTQKLSGRDYVKTEAPYNGICNVCHSADSKHFTSVSGDSHNLSRTGVCTNCHEHRFSDSHASGQSCGTAECHRSKPVPRHSGFGLPRDCTKCHAGPINLRMDVMKQFNANSHHVQGVTINNHHCYDCHWESTDIGLINPQYHTGYDFKRYTSVKNDVVDLVVWGPNHRPTYYNSTTAVRFLASRMGNTTTAVSRAESAKLNNHCLSCHSDQNNNTTPFGDCKTPRQYAWDNQSIAARYSQKATVPWGKYNSTTYPKANKKDAVGKAFSAHGNAVGNHGGFSPTTGFDSTIPDTRNGVYNVNCFDCHNSHGSKVGPITSSYVTFNGTKNGGNLKETQAGKGGYAMSYWASQNPNMSSINPYNAGAGQCFDCHLTQTHGTTPWGYQSTFGASQPIMAYTDTQKFGQGTKAYVARYPFRDSKKTIVGGHFKASSFLTYSTSAKDKIGGLCTPCHDPHGVSPSLEGEQAYAVPLLKGTWMTSPYQDDNALASPSGTNHVYAEPTWRIDRNTFSDMYTNTKRINEKDSQFAGLCLRCHRKGNLTDGTNKNTAFKSLDRVHESVQGWGANDEHSFTCSKCHQPHNSGLKRLMQTNCLDISHRNQVPSGGYANTSGWRCGNVQGFPRGKYSYNSGVRCHGDSDGLTNYPADIKWNNVTTWP